MLCRQSEQLSFLLPPMLEINSDPLPQQTLGNAHWERRSISHNIASELHRRWKDLIRGQCLRGYAVVYRLPTGESAPR